MTFLLTDVVDSTVLWERSSDAMAMALERHDELVRDAVTSHRGIFLKHRGEGDSTFAVFSQPSAALAAACSAQRALIAEPWDASTPIWVRIGIHTGEAVERDRDYYGLTVNRAARLRALATGGQVLVSDTTAQLAGGAPDGTELVFLRTESLRGIGEPEPIHELVDHTRTQRAPEPRNVRHSTERSLPPAIVSAAATPFAGRTTQLALLRRLRARAEAGVPQVVLLGGEPGAGKTSLAAHAAAAAHAEGWTVLHGICDDELAIPYEAFRDALDQYIGAAPRALLAEHVAKHGGEVGRLAPRLAERIGAIAPVDPLDQETARQLLAAAVTDLVQRASTDTPLMVVLDDLHWADRSTLMLLRRLARLRGQARCMIVTTYRTADVGQNDFRELLPDLLSLPAVTNLRVEGLTEQELTELLEIAGGHAVGEDGLALARYLAGETGGNPFFATEVLRHFAETEVIGVDDDGRWRVQVDLNAVAAPDNVRSVLSARLARLGHPALRLLSVGAIIGREFDLGLLADVAGVDEASALDSIDVAVDASLVREIGAGRFGFSHALVQHTLYDSLGATRRAIHHRRIAETLEHTDNPSATEIATHWVAV
ncbi:MAG TPA: AAA family ATPase, partial [Acidimicrobiales bacterium]|nr:AAA family ATPase [Acidimicrobiales bacterium]